MNKYIHNYVWNSRKGTVVRLLPIDKGIGYENALHFHMPNVKVNSEVNLLQRSQVQFVNP